ncbi:MAG: transposase [Myxococcales bacterium]|nr:transposase [Myxococcales bacterium]
MERYIGLDAHAESCILAVISERGNRLKSAVVETNGRALIEFIKTIPGNTHLCLEEGTQSAWLYEILSPHVDAIVVTHMQQRSQGRKDDLTDAFARAEDMRRGAVTPVFKDGGRLAQLRAHVEVQAQATADLVRVRNRLKALYRSRGVSAPGGEVYTTKHRETYLAKLPKPYRPSAALLYAQQDALHAIKKEADKQLIEQSHKHAISRTLETCPGLGPIRVAQVLAAVMSPHRFRTSRQLWSYCGLGIVMRSSSDWVMGPAGWHKAAVNKTRGLNRQFNRRLKLVFKGAATAVIQHRAEPMYGDYRKMIDQGTKPPLAKLTLARRIAATALAMWKRGGLRPREISKQRMNARLWRRPGTRSRCAEASRSTTSSMVRGRASIEFLDTCIMQESPYIGYALSEYQPIRWPQQALIEGWCPLLRGAQGSIADDWEAELDRTSDHVAALVACQPLGKRTPEVKDHGGRIDPSLTSFSLTRSGGLARGAGSGHGFSVPDGPIAAQRSNYTMQL